MNLSPYHSAWIASNLGLTYCVMGRLAAGERVFRQAPSRLSARLYRPGRDGKPAWPHRDARRAATMIERLDPLFRAEEWGRSQLYTDPAVVEAFTHDLKRAGVQ